MLPTFGTVEVEISANEYLKNFVYSVRKGFDDVSIPVMTSQLSDDLTTFIFNICKLIQPDFGFSPISWPILGRF